MSECHTVWPSESVKRQMDRGTDRTENITLTVDVGGKHVILDHRQCPLFILPNDVDDPVILNIAKTVTCRKEYLQVFFLGLPR